MGIDGKASRAGIGPAFRAINLIGAELMPKDITKMSFDEINNMPTLGNDDTFSFRCKACGKCCKNRKDISLSAHDLFRLAAYLDRKPQEIVERYCEILEGNSLFFPILWLKPVAPDASCPFLRNKKCSVHSASPCVCRVYPLARMYKMTGPPRFYFNGSNCKHAAEPIKVKDWIAEFATEEYARIGRLWTDVKTCFSEALDPKNLVCSADKRQNILNDIFAMLWLSYNVKEPFFPQLSHNIELLRGYLDTEYSLTIPTKDFFIQRYKEEFGDGQNDPAVNEITGGTDHV